MSAIFMIRDDSKYDAHNSCQLRVAAVLLDVSRTLCGPAGLGRLFTSEHWSFVELSSELLDN